MCIRGGRRVFQTNLVGPVQSVDSVISEATSRILWDNHAYLQQSIFSQFSLTLYLQNSEFFMIEPICTYK